ncbi:hypothetical protein QJS04_geneDACA022804 [Acorus gramineus]|uniref:Uncharacterized protein n=1 Tax=Acorus gramineus TaxID=55184 RepID=A0AAV9B1G3_ACOGR|nr:hypothetical protein QJS04_geneDACA022804 [Acorus gramineus]
MNSPPLPIDNIPGSPSMRASPTCGSPVAAMPATEDQDFVHSLAELKELLSVDLATAVQSEHRKRLLALSTRLKDPFRLTLTQCRSIDRLCLFCNSNPEM